MHAYTALGLVLAAFVAVLIVRGDPESLRRALLLLLVANAIDASDGFLARRAQVQRVLPGFDGRRLDDITDFHTYTSLPLLLIWRAGLLPAAQAPWLLLPLLASAYGFSQADVKTGDGYFRGFPSYWNVLALYLYLLQPPAGLTLALLVVFSLLTFVPSKYLYPSRPGRLNRWAAGLGLVWAGALLLVLLDVLAQPRAWLLASLVFPLYYLLASWSVTLREWRRARPAGAPGTSPTS